ncbi:single myb histone 6-like [Phoenix dactylifera]|uniref:Single myb histone 6-like n=1 Tax=Phoenix dactylifera TaxID=42345 RepID=A0A8B9AQU2_PHODC|nr:single myb histone 6-like [Phoenix dactylifera]XP_038987890.1 single myb histone 6-like [Phoenix dactylifera]XP_038987891.1 single myb histone 6-like [Phoenix dactylifera]XP_038987892.1 single myb histone 6-like [Phoenix dactylifera]XP_038987893.1 single myb histone 6-like [Phoenix dactylifera]
MGAPKQKWTAEEEAALRAGVVKHGAGKWRTILKDPEFSGILRLRSNVDLKDKWRNMSVTANGWGSREKARIALKKSRQISKNDDNPKVLNTEVEDIDNEIVDTKHLAMSSESLKFSGPKRSISRLDNLIMEAITTLKEPTGSNKTAIAMYIEEQYWLPLDFKRLLSAKLKALTASGKLIKVKRKYRIAPSSVFSERRNSKVFLLEEMKLEPPKPERDDIKVLTKAQVDSELAQMRSMTAEEAAAVAAKAVSEAEAAIKEAEEAAREAEAAEAEAEAAKAFAEAAMLTLKKRNAAKLMVRV